MSASSVERPGGWIEVIESSSGNNPFAPAIYTASEVRSATTQFGIAGDALPECPAGHSLDESSEAEYIDGLLVGTCAGCGSRMQVRRLPGGMPGYQLDGLIQRMLDEEDEPVFWIDRAVGELGDIREQLAKERAALEDAEAKVRLAERLMRRRMGFPDEGDVPCES